MSGSLETRRNGFKWTEIDGNEMKRIGAGSSWSERVREGRRGLEKVGASLKVLNVESD